MKSLLTVLLLTSFTPFGPFNFLNEDPPAPEPVQVVEPAPVVKEKSKKKLLYFTATWCGPCQNFKRNELPKLVKQGFDIEVYDIDETPEVYRKWKKSDRYIPLFVFIGEDGKEYSRTTGYQTSTVISKIWNAE